MRKCVLMVDLEGGTSGIDEWSEGGNRKSVARTTEAVIYCMVSFKVVLICGSEVSEKSIYGLRSWYGK